MPLGDAESLEVAKRVKLVAVVGMTDGSKPGRASFDIPEVLQSRGIRVIPVNPMIKVALGEKAYAHLAEIPEKFEWVNVFRRPDAIPEVADEILALPPEKRPEGVWLQTGISHPESEARLEAAGMKVVSDRCLGVYVARTGRGR